MLSKRYVKIEVSDSQLTIEANGKCDEVCADAVAGLAELLKTAAKRNGTADSLETYFGAAITALEKHLESLTGKPRKRCTCQAEAKPEGPAKRMTPEEFNAFIDAWVSQSTPEEKVAFLIASHASDRRREQGSSL